MNSNKDGGEERSSHTLCSGGKVGTWKCLRGQYAGLIAYSDAMDAYSVVGLPKQGKLELLTKQQPSFSNL